MRCLYTGDYSRVPDRHLPGADTPDVKPDMGAWGYGMHRTTLSQSSKSRAVCVCVCVYKAFVSGDLGRKV